jgi:hypothetical protein
MSSHVWIDDITGATLLEVNSPKYGVFIAWIDSEDAERVSAHSWHVQMDGRGRVYFKTMVRKPDGKRNTLLLHRLLKVCPDGEEVDHGKHEYLDLRKDELRCVTGQQNGYNRRSNSNTTSQYKGVSWFKQTSKWRASIRHNGKDIHLGYFPPTPEGEIAASQKYDCAAIELFGEHAKLNHPREWYEFVQAAA